MKKRTLAALERKRHFLVEHQAMSLQDASVIWKHASDTELFFNPRILSAVFLASALQSAPHSSEKAKENESSQHCSHCFGQHIFLPFHCWETGFIVTATLFILPGLCWSKFNCVSVKTYQRWEWRNVFSINIEVAMFCAFSWNWGSNRTLGHMEHILGFMFTSLKEDLEHLQRFFMCCTAGSGSLCVADRRSLPLLLNMRIWEFFRGLTASPSL